MTQTLDQKRAKFAWTAAQKAVKTLAKFDDYKNLAKGAPALIMGNGLMPALAFYQSRGKPHAHLLVNDMLGWLARVNAGYTESAPVMSFDAAMSGMHSADSLMYMRLTDEALAMLKWLRQFVDSVSHAEMN